MNVVLVNFHRYQPYGQEFYAPILKFFVDTMSHFSSEYDRVVFLDSTWGITPEDIQSLGMSAEVIKTDPSSRYYDTYKTVLKECAWLNEDNVLFLDNDMVIYKPGCIRTTFDLLDKYDVVSIYDTCGTYATSLLNGKNKFCPYWFASRSNLLLKYIDCEWGPGMPEHETLGKLTEVMLNNGLIPFELEEDKTSIYFDGIKDPEVGKNLGYYHIRAGSVPAYLLSEKKYGNPNTYWAYIDFQPKREFLRQCAWYQYMGGNPAEIVQDAQVSDTQWDEYYQQFLQYHGLA